MKEQTIIISNLLPRHYTCEPRDNGVHCHSSQGINDILEEEYFNAFLYALKMIFKDRFVEVHHQTCTNHVKFTVFLKW